MSCEEIESRFLDYLEGQLPPGQRAEVAGHLAGCAECRQLARQLQQLDLAFSNELKTPVLSASFDRRLRERIQTAPALTEAERAERKRQLQAEFESGLARLRHGTFALRNLLGQMVWPALAMTAGATVWFLTATLVARFNAHGLGGFAPDQLAWLVASAIVLTFGLPRLFPSRLEEQA